MPQENKSREDRIEEITRCYCGDNTGDCIFGCMTVEMIRPQVTIKKEAHNVTGK